MTLPSSPSPADSPAVSELSRPSQRSREPLSDSDQIKRRMERLCERDDAPGVLRFLARQDARTWHELTHSAYPIDYAIESDAPRVFEALIDLSLTPEDDGGGLSQRLWGGQIPIHRCAYLSDGESLERSALKCLGVILRRDPAMALARDEEGRGALDWAAMNRRPDAFNTLVESLADSVMKGIVSAEDAKAVAEQASFCLVVYPHQPEKRLEQLESLQTLGLDWRQARTTEGQSLLGRCLKPISYNSWDGADAMAALLIQAGADLSAPCIKESAPFTAKKAPSATAPSCAERLFNPADLPWESVPSFLLAFEAAALSLSPEALIERMEARVRGSSFEEAALASGAPQAALALARKEALVLVRSTPSAASRPAPKL